MSKEISQAVIRRMPRYYRYLGELLDEGVEPVSYTHLDVYKRQIYRWGYTPCFSKGL